MSRTSAALYNMARAKVNKTRRDQKMSLRAMYASGKMAIYIKTILLQNQAEHLNFVDIKVRAKLMLSLC